NPKHRALYDRILDAVRVVGYPSQMLHDAQVNKIALRDIEMLREAASYQRHPRFHEAWLLLGTADYTRYKPEHRLTLLNFLNEICSSKRLEGYKLVQAKAVDALASLGRVAAPEELAILGKAFDSMGHWLARQNAEADIC